MSNLDFNSQWIVSLIRKKQIIRYSVAYNVYSEMPRFTLVHTTYPQPIDLVKGLIEGIGWAYVLRKF